MTENDKPRALRLCPLEDIPEHGGRGFTVKTGEGTAQVFLIRKDGNVHAYENRCPHVGTPLDWQPDQFLDSSGTLIQCSTHGALFRIEDGYCVYGPCARQSLQAVKVEVREGEVYLGYS